MVPDDEMPGIWIENKDTGNIYVLRIVVLSTRLFAAIVAVGALGSIRLCRTGTAAWSVSA
jgi:hypothetical protein